MRLIVTAGHPGMMAGPGLYQKPVFLVHQIQKTEMPSLSTQGPVVMDIKLLIKWIQIFKGWPGIFQKVHGILVGIKVVGKTLGNYWQVMMNAIVS